METALISAAAIVSLGLLTSLRILFEYERGVVFRLGKVRRARGPGLIFLVPFGVERMKKMDLRIVALDVARQDTIGTVGRQTRGHSGSSCPERHDPHAGSTAVGDAPCGTNGLVAGALELTIATFRKN